MGAKVSPAVLDEPRPHGMMGEGGFPPGFVPRDDEGIFGGAGTRARGREDGGPPLGLDGGKKTEEGLGGETGKGPNTLGQRRVDREDGDRVPAAARNAAGPEHVTLVARESEANGFGGAEEKPRGTSGHLRTFDQGGKIVNIRGSRDSESAKHPGRDGVVSDGPEERGGGAAHA